MKVIKVLVVGVVFFFGAFPASAETYSGEIVDTAINHHYFVVMNLHLNGDRSVSGYYYYTKYKTRIPLTGEYEGEHVTLKAGNEMFVGDIRKTEATVYLSGKWSKGDKELEFHVSRATGPFKKIVSLNAVCDVALEELNSNASGKTSEIESMLNGKRGEGVFVTPDGHPYKEFTRPASFDFDNDGYGDRVFSYSGAGSYLTGDIFYVAFGKKGAAREKERLSISDVSIFPCQFDTSVTDPGLCPTISQGADEAGIRVAFDKEGENVFFRGRYTGMTPIKYDDMTYIILRSFSGSSQIYSAVIYPFERTKYNAVCLFKKEP